MKSVKSIILIITILVSGLSFAGCKEDPESSQSGTERTTVTVAPETTEPGAKKEKKDSAVVELNNRIVKLDSLVSLNGEAIKSSKKNNDEKFADANLLILIAFTVAALALVIAGISIYLLNKQQESIKRHRQEIESLKAKNSNIQTGQLPSQTAKVNSDHLNLTNRVLVLERMLSQIQAPQTQAASQPVAVKATPVQTGYFGVPSQMSQTQAYFKKLIKTASDSDVRFQAVIKGNKADFTPLVGEMYLASLKSSETMKLAVETTGCLLSDATSMTALTPGKAEFRDGRWVITEKARINLQ